MTGSSIIQRVREQLSDQIADYRWSDSILLLYLNDARRAVVKVHPEATYVTAITTAPLSEMTGLTEETGIVDTYFNALVHYICYKVMLEDSENAGNASLATGHLGLFDKEMA